MKLLTKAQQKRIPNLHSQEEVKDPMVYLFIRIGRSFWLITELDQEQELAFGWCDLFGNGEGGELGYVSLEEINEIGKDYFIAMKEIEMTLSEAKKIIYR